MAASLMTYNKNAADKGANPCQPLPTMTEQESVMSTNILTQETLRELLYYDPETGVFAHKRRVGMPPFWYARFSGKPAGWTTSGYVYIRIAQKKYLAHRLVWLYVYGKWPDNQIDHINGNPSDNRLVNLRDVSQSVNIQNKRTSHKNSSSKYLGVCLHKKTGKWSAQIREGGRLRHIGVFDKEETAHAAYLKAKRKLHPGFVEERWAT